jgi:hypothetical protein
LYDYRTACISVLAEKDPHATAVRLSKLLLEKPSSVLAEFSAPLLAADHRYETAPLLMRYALLEHSPCTEALEAMRIPNAALAILRTAAIYGELTSSGNDFPISQGDRQRLTVLLGKDAGPNFHDWTHFYDQSVDQRPTPLSRQDVLEIKRITDAIESYWAGMERLYEAKCRLLIRRLKDQDDGRLAGAIATLESLQQRRHYLTVVDVDSLDANSSYLVRTCFQKAIADMSVAPPNWAARGTADLEHEVKDYGSRVDAMIAQYDGPDATTQPATVSPATEPESPR